MATKRFLDKENDFNETDELESEDGILTPKSPEDMELDAELEDPLEAAEIEEE